MTTTMLPEENPKRGDIVLILFPHSDLRTAKTRPALVTDVAIDRVIGKISMQRVDQALKHTLGL